MPDGFALFHRICSLAFENYVIIFWMGYRRKKFSFTFLTVSFQGTEMFLKIYQLLIYSRHFLLFWELKTSRDCTKS